MWWSEPRRVAIGLAALLLAGCGFHLQGALTLPEGVRTVHVSTRDELTPFAVELRRALERSGAQVAPSSAGADAVIRIRQDRTGRRVLSVSARNTPQEFEVYYSVEFAIDRGGAEALAPQQLDATRYFSFDESLLLAKDREEASLREAMARDLADLVLRQLGSL
jgi:LPS-assembly lipoprotein